LRRIPIGDEVAGDIRLGFVNQHTIFGILPQEIVQHLLIIGRSGAGKTTIFRIIMLELYRLHIPFLAFDLAKYGTRYLKHAIPELVILRWDKEFFFNPLKPPPKVKLVEWMLTFCEITSEVFGLRAASKSYLIGYIKFLYDKFATQKTNRYPTIIDFFVSLEKDLKTTKGPSKDYIYRIKNKFDAIHITLGKVLNVEQGVPIQEILKYPACIELVGINSVEIQTWMVSLIMAWIALYRTAHTHLGKLRHCVFYDEAAQAFGKG